MPTPHSDFPNVRRSPDAARHHGFALLVTITLLSFLVLLLVSLAALTRVETQVANNSQLLAQARQNALFGLQIALGELQRHAGPDQRISVPATTVYPAKNVTSASGKLFDLYRNRADTTSGARKTFLTTAGRPLWESDLRAWWAEENRNPHWTGIYDSGLRRDAAVPSARYGEPRRDQLPRWLVSGNERPAMNFDAATATTYPTGYLTPDKDLATQPGVDPADIVELVGAGSSSSKDDSIDGLSGTVRVVRQPLAGTPPGTTAPQTIGHYAYWVGDESQKANFAVRDPWFDENDPDTLEYRNRLLVPQRIGWERINGFREVFDSGTGLSVNDDRFLKILAREQIPLLDPNFREPVKNAFHHLTAYSRSLHTDTALGGLKKDLTVFLQGTGSGLPLSEPIASPSLYANSDPRLGGGTGFPSSVANVATFGDLKHWADTDVPNEAASVSVEPGRAPVVVNFQILFAFTRSGSPSRLRMHFIPCVVLWNPFDTALAETTYDLGWRHNVALFQIGVATKGLTDPSADNADGMIMPAPHSDYFVHPLTRINDWFFATDKFFTNLSRPLLYIPPSSTTTTPNLYLAPFDRRDTAAPSSYGDRYLPTLPNGDRNPKVTWVPYRFTTGFKAGQVKVFTIANSQFVSDVANLHSGNTVIQLKNGFDPDFPKSFYFDIADLGNPPADNADTRMYANFSLGSSPATLAMDLSANGNVLWRNINTGSIDSWGSAVKLPTMKGDDPNTWRSLLLTDDWESKPKSGAVNNVDHALIGMLYGFLHIFNPSAGSFRTGSDLNASQATNFQRGFASYNLAATSLDIVPYMEGGRDSWPGNNSDDFKTVTLMQTKGMSGSNTKQWDRAIHHMNDSGETEGFALIQSAQLDATLGNSGLTTIPLRHVRRADSQILSLAQFQQINVSHFAWQPSFPIGNSEASPYIDRARLTGLQSYTVGSAKSDDYTVYPAFVRSPGLIPNGDKNHHIDLSYLFNEGLWDRYFLSSIPQTSAVSLDNTIPLPNSRHRFRRSPDLTTSEARNFNTAAAYLENIGALNVNSTSVEAWKSLLTAFRDLRIRSDASENPADTVPISRTLDPLDSIIRYAFGTRNLVDIGAAADTSSTVVSPGRNYTKFFTSYRYLTDDMIQALSERIVDEVRLRGPFFSVADFVNRRLVSPDRSGGDPWLSARTKNLSSNIDSLTQTMDASYNPLVGLAGITGALQRAINLSGVNGGLNSRFVPDNLNDRAFRTERVLTNINGSNVPLVMYPSAAHYLDTEHLAGAPVGEVGQLLSHSPGFVSQADILGMIGPALTARGDTFLVRSYGDSLNPATGEVQSRAWLEAVVQRVPTPVTPAGTSGEDRFRPTDAFGRKFVILSLRWLGPNDI